VHLVVVDADADQPDALGLLARQRLAQQQVVLGLGQPAQQRPDDRGVVAGRDAEPGVAVDDLRGAAGDRDVGEQGDGESRADRRALDRAHDRLGAVDDVVDDVAGLAQDAGAHLVVGHHLLDHVEVAAGRERRALAADDDGAHVVVGVGVAPDLGELAVAGRVDGVEPSGRAQRHSQDSVGGPVDLQPLVRRVAHRSS
jgi:hypothetical protein